MRHLLSASLALLCVGALPGAAAACSQPLAPSCVSSYGNFDDQDDFDRCRREMVDYKDEVDRYIRCLKGEIEDHNDEIEELVRKGKAANSAYGDAVDAFNGRAR